ncbi:MAG: alpha-2-macroglobulin family protein [Planctomycetota bacterium]
MTPPDRNPWKWLAIANTAALWIVFGILGARFVGRADRAIRTQIEEAQASPAEEAARILDEISLSGLDDDLASDVAHARVDAWLALFRERVLRDGAPPSPFELMPYRLEEAPLPPRAELSRVTARLRSALAEWRDIAVRSGAPVEVATERAESLAIVTQYALGEVPYDDVQPSDDEARFQFGDLLFRERQFERAIEAWRPILDDKRVIAKLAELAALRRLAPQGLHVWDYEVEGLLGRDPSIEAEAAARVERLFASARTSPRDVVERAGIPRDDVSDPTEEPAIFFPEAAQPDVGVPKETWVQTEAEQLYLLTDHAQFRLEPTTDRPFSSAGVRFTLHSAYRGPIRARLYRVGDRKAFSELTDKALVSRRSGLSLVREWEVQFAPIWTNSMEVGTWELQVPEAVSGLYVLIADARYCPVYAVARFVVTDVALVQQVASDRVLVFAAERLTGKPVAGLPLEGRVVCLDDQRVVATVQGTTGSDGLFEWSVAPAWEEGLRYSVETSSSNPDAPSTVESLYPPSGTSVELKALVYGDRPLYRPGDTVSWKAILRCFDAEGLRAYDGQEADLEFRTSRRVLAAITCEVTELGTASGSFRLPTDCELGACTVSVNHGRPLPVFVVEEYRKPELEIVLRGPGQVRAGAPVDVEVHARYFTGTPLANTQVTVTLEALPAAPKVADPTAAWFSSHGRAGGRQIESRTLTTDRTGRCVYRFQAEQGAAARYVVEARAVEASGREVRMWTTVEAAGEAPAPPVAAGGGGETPTSGLRIAPDRPFYHVGDTARLHVEGPAGHVLVTLATGRIRHREVVLLQDGAAEVTIQVGEDDVPNVEIVAVDVRNDALERATARLLVSPEDRFLTVDVETDRAEYRPGQGCRATIRVTDSKGRPVPDCEISLGVVNEAIYALHEDATPDLREFFHRQLRPLAVEQVFDVGEGPRTFIVWKAPTFVKGMINLFESLGVGGGGGRYGGRFGGKENLVARGGLAHRPPRSDFRDTAYWNAHLRTDADGKASVEFRLPDDLTRLRFTARGITRDHKVGAVRQRAVVRLPFYVRLAAPRVLQEGNTIAVAGLIHNDTGEAQVVRCSFEAPFRVLLATAPPALALGPGEVAQVQYLLSVDRHLPEVELTFRASCDDGPSDAVTVTVPGRRNGVPFQEGRSGSIEGPTPGVEVFLVPEDSIQGAARLVLHASPGLDSAIVDALAPLIEYPYGCVEQTMSRFFPAVSARRMLGGSAHPLSEKLPAVLEAGLKRLYHFQHADGGWGWWETDPTNEGMTAYVLYGLSICAEAGVEVDPDVARRAAAFLRERLEKALLADGIPLWARAPLAVTVDPRVYALMALAEYETAWADGGVSTRPPAERLLARIATLTHAEEVMLALACERLGMREEADRLVARIEARKPADVVTASLLLQLRAARGGEAADVVRFVLLERVGTGWRTTIESAYAILGLASIHGGAATRAARGTVRIEVNGAPAGEIVFPGELSPSFDGRVSIPEPPGGWERKLVVRLSYDGEDSAFYAASFEGMRKAETAPETEGGIEVSREYYVRDKDGWTLLDGEAPVGAAILVRLQVQTSSPREYVMVTDPRGDGFEPVDAPVTDLRLRKRIVEGLTDRVELSDGWEARLAEFRRGTEGDVGRESAWAIALLREIVERRRFTPRARDEAIPAAPGTQVASFEHRDDRTIFFVAALPAGTSRFYYMVRAEHPGVVRILPPQVVPMYEPELHGMGVAARIRVSDGVLILSSGPRFAAPPGMEGLLDVIGALDEVDADKLFGLIPSGPRIGDLLMGVVGERQLRVWLSTDAATRTAGAALHDRIEAARRDIVTRRLCAEALPADRADWLPAIDEALGSGALARLVFDYATIVEPAQVDSALLWAVEDREMRVVLLAAAQRLRGTALVDVAAFRAVTVDGVIEAFGSKAPTGDDLVRWRLSQRGRFPAGTLGELTSRLDRDLGLKFLSAGDFKHAAVEGRVSDVLDRVLGSAGLFFQVRDGLVRAGPLEDMVR